MTSTNIFSGINEGRNSSKVLRPPGGGSTDILGVGIPQKMEPRLQKTQEKLNCDRITEKSTEKEPENLAEKSESQMEISSENQMNGSSKNQFDKPPEEFVEKPTEEEVDKSSKKQVEEPSSTEVQEKTVRRQRVPPGGYSSGGFW